MAGAFSRFIFKMQTKGARDAFKRGADGIGAPLMKIIGVKLTEQVVRTFARGVDPVTGAKWKRTSPGALAIRASGGGETMKATGRLMRSLSRPAKVTGKSARIGTGIRYAEAHQLGMTIRAKSGKSLAIPITREAARAGSCRRWWAQKESQGLKPFVLKGVVLLPNRAWTGGKNSQKKNTLLDAHWVLKKSVNIPQRRFLGVGATYGAEIEKTMAGFIEALLKRKGGAAA